MHLSGYPGTVFVTMLFLFFHSHSLIHSASGFFQSSSCFNILDLVYYELLETPVPISIWQFHLRGGPVSTLNDLQSQVIIIVTTCYMGQYNINIRMAGQNIGVQSSRQKKKWDVCFVLNIPMPFLKALFLPQDLPKPHYVGWFVSLSENF